MRKKTGRALVSALSLTLVAASLAACSGNDSKDSGTAGASPSAGSPSGSASGTAASSPSAGDAAKSPKTGGKFDPPVTITTAMPVGDDVKFRDGETINDNVMMKWFRDNMGIDIKVLWTTKTVDDYQNKQKLMFASNQDIPDVMIVNDPSILANFIEAGQLKDISADFAQYASKRFQDSYATQPSIWNSVLRGDKKYGLPLPGDGMAKGALFFR
ncbi:extracellular solute-binding protein, partial [Cohnella sp. CBP 2801]